MPGCTAGSEAPVTAITTSMMMAYAAMRNGVTPNRAGGDGTLIEAMLAFNSGDNPQYVLLPGVVDMPLSVQVFWKYAIEELLLTFSFTASSQK